MPESNCLLRCILVCRLRFDITKFSPILFWNLLCPKQFGSKETLRQNIVLKTKFLVKKCLSPILWSKNITSKTFLIGKLGIKKIGWERVSINKLGLSWAKLSSNWDWTLILVLNWTCTELANWNWAWQFCSLYHQNPTWSVCGVCNNTIASHNISGRLTGS